MAHSSWKPLLVTTLSCGLVAAPLSALPAAATGTPEPTGSGVIINEAYLSGGSAGAAFKNKFVELYNTTAAPVDLAGWSLQYRSATGTAAPQGVAPLEGTIPAGETFLVQLNSNGSAGAELPAPDAVTSLAPSGTNGTLILSNQASAVTDLGIGSVVLHPKVVDLLGYGTSNTFETAAAGAPTGNQDVRSLNRTDFLDTDNNQADFSLSTEITPENSGPEPTPQPTAEPTAQPTAEPTTEPTAEPTTGQITPIADIQGTGEASPLLGATVTTRGKVTAAYPAGGFNGYYIQTPGTGGAIDESHTASHGIFVYSSATVDEVQVGDFVEVTGTVGEYRGLTQLSVADGGVLKLDAAAEEVKAATVAFPDTDAEREVLEGMLLSPQGSYTVTDNYGLNQYGEIGLATGETPLLQPTVAGLPGTPEHEAVVAENEARAVTLDDGATTNFFNGANKDQPLPYLTGEDHVRVGSAATFSADVVLDFRYDAWRFQPVAALTPANAAAVQPAGFSDTRSAAPAEVGGDVQLATFNVLNYFTTTGDQLEGCTYYTDRAGNPITVRSGCDARGAANAENLQRQQDKLVAAINSLDADVVSLNEIENSAAFGKDRDEALAALTAALNAAAPGTDGSGTWDYVRSPLAVPASEDVIRTGFIYRKGAVEPVGESVILDHEAFTNLARQPLAQAFKPVGAGDEDKFIAIANHFKSKGSAATPEDTDQGQGNSNLARTAQAEALVDFAQAEQDRQGTDKVFLMGDFNAYAAEDPMRVLEAAGYVNQSAKTGEHSYAFGGMVGSLDHILASPAAAGTVTGADIWNINSVESVALEYSRYNYNATNFYSPDVYRSSDHDPILVGLDLDGAAAATAEVNLLNINDFHGRIDANTVNFAGTVEQLKAQAPESSLFLSAGDNVGASVFASSVQQDQPTIDVLNALGLQASAVGNHEFDGGLSDLTDRIIGTEEPNAEFAYLGANVYEKGTTTPALDEYEIFDVNGVKVAVIGAVTEETASLVSPGGIAAVEFGDPVEAVNRVAAEIEAQDLADVIVAEYHEGAREGTPDGSTPEEEIADGGVFTSIVTETSAEVDAIFTGHTHKQYAWSVPVPGAPDRTRPIVQTGSYGENIGQVELTIDTETNDLVAHTAANVARTKESPESLVAAFPAVATVKTIVDAALAHAQEVGEQPVGSVAADITTAYVGERRDDRGSESTLGNLVADSLVSSLSDPERGGAQIGVVNPGGLRAELLHAPDGVITYAEANAVLPFLNNLWTTSLTGAQFKTLLEQQWQTNADGTVPSRSFLNLGLSQNVSYTYDPNAPLGSHITSVTIDGEPLDPAASYRIGTFSFLAQGGDNFRVLTEGADTRDSGLVDRDAWVTFLAENPGLVPNFERRGVAITGAPEFAVPGQEISFQASKLDLTSLGSPANTSVEVFYRPAEGADISLGTAEVADGAADVTVTVPESADAGSLYLVASASNTTAVIPTTVAPRFADVPAGTQFEDEISWLAARGITTGWEDDTFRPWQPIDRDAMAAFLYRMAGSPEYTAPEVSPFTDVTPQTRYYKEIAWLAEQDIADGWEDGTFRPWDSVNRDAVAAFLYRLAGSPEYTAPEVSPFTDVTPQTQFYKEIAWLAGQEITTGWEDGSYRPVTAVNRDAIAAFLYRWDARF